MKGLSLWTGLFYGPSRYMGGSFIPLATLRRSCGRSFLGGSSLSRVGMPARGCDPGSKRITGCSSRAWRGDEISTFIEERNSEPSLWGAYTLVQKEMND